MNNVSETTPANTELASQYHTQVAGDLERNVKEQERLSGEIEALQTQLAALQHDQTVLMNIQQALGVTMTPVAERGAAVPAQKKSTAPSGKGKQPRTEKPAAAGRKRTSRKSTAKSTTTKPAQPKLVDLVREHLAAQSEPRSAAEITTALAQQYPERNIKATVVRTTVEGLVGKSKAERTKQGRAVFYTATDAAK